jgi:8-oxo-dGTP pyrophosphatase MutT (NUDIX family)
VHYIQKHVLDDLRQSPTLRYSQLQPADIESSHFKYHLNQLVKDGFVEQVSRGVYRLTQKGMSKVDTLSAGRINPHQGPKLITYTLIKNKNHYFLHLKNKEPYIGLLNMVGGKIHSGETSKDAATRELKEKAGFIADDLKLRGVAEIQIEDSETLLSHVTAYIYSQDIDESTETLESLEAIPKEKLIAHSDLAPDLLKLLAAIDSNSKPFVISIFTHL